MFFIFKTCKQSYVNFKREGGGRREGEREEEAVTAAAREGALWIELGLPSPKLNWMGNGAGFL